MLEYFPLFKTLADATDGLRLRARKAKGKRNEFFRELRNNVEICWMAVEKGTPFEKAIPKLQDAVYQRLAAESFNFDEFQRGPVSMRDAQKASAIGGLEGKSTVELVDNVFEKIRSIKNLFDLDPTNERVDFRRRLLNIHQRLLLLVQHLNG